MYDECTHSDIRVINENILIVRATLHKLEIMRFSKSDLAIDDDDLRAAVLLSKYHEIKIISCIALSAFYLILNHRTDGGDRYLIELRIQTSRVGFLFSLLVPNLGYLDLFSFF